MADELDFWTRDEVNLIAVCLDARSLGAFAATCRAVHSNLRSVDTLRWLASLRGLEASAGISSLEHLETTGANWVSIVVTTYQHSINTTSIFPLYNASQVPPDYYTYVTESDADVVAAIRKAKALGLKVMLKPHINVAVWNIFTIGDICACDMKFEAVRFNRLETRVEHH